MSDTSDDNNLGGRHRKPARPGRLAMWGSAVGAAFQACFKPTRNQIEARNADRKRALDRLAENTIGQHRS